MSSSVESSSRGAHHLRGHKADKTDLERFDFGFAFFFGKRLCFNRFLLHGFPHSGGLTIHLTSNTLSVLLLHLPLLLCSHAAGGLCRHLSVLEQKQNKRKSHFKVFLFL